MKKLFLMALLALGVFALLAPPAQAADDKPFTIHGEVRFRAEVSNNTTDFNDDGAADDGYQYFPYRVRIAAEGHFTKNISAWIEFQNANVAGDTAGTVLGPIRTGFGTEGSDVEMYQGNITLHKLWSDTFTLRIGRQEIVAGNELLLGDLDFYTGISHDGGVGMWDFDDVDVMVWYTRPFESAGLGGGTGNFPPDQVGAIADANTHFWGGYADWTFGGDQTFDVYGMNLNGPFNGVDVWTIGARYAHDKTDSDGWIWNVEGAQQFGDAAGGVADAEGRVFEGWFGYNWKSGSNVHRIYGRLEQATGDDTSAGSTDFEGFIPMFGDFHNRTGRGDWFRLDNATTGLGAGIANGGLSAFSVGYNGFYNDRHEFGAAYWTYTLEEDNGGADDLGDAIDAWYGFNYSRNLNFVVSLSRLSPDDALTGVGGFDDDVMRLYGQARLRF